MEDFFFQAEDGIRDGHVTGVQTCALPILPRLKGLDCRHVHFAWLHRPLEEAERQQLEELLRHDGYPETTPVADEGWLRLVVPRQGTHSPWSSQAAEVLRRGGLDAVQRLERGVAWHVEGGPLGGADQPRRATPRPARRAGAGWAASDRAGGGN